MGARSLTQLKTANRNFDNVLDSYLNLTDGGTVAGAVSLSSTLGVTGTATMSGQLLVSGELVHNTELVNEDSQNATLLVAELKKGLIVHTSTTGGGTITTDTAANIIAGLPLSNDGDTFQCYFVNDGDQTDTIAAGSGVTLGDAGNTILETEACLLVFRRTGAAAVTVYQIGA